MAVVDASWLIGLVDLDDDHHAAASAQYADADSIVIAPVALAEVAYYIWTVRRAKTSRRQAQDEARRIVADLVGLHIVRTQETTDMVAAIRLMEQSPGLSLPDAVVALTAKELHDDLWTFDRQQRRAFESW